METASELSITHAERNLFGDVAERIIHAPLQKPTNPNHSPSWTANAVCLRSVCGLSGMPLVGKQVFTSPQEKQHKTWQSPKARCSNMSTSATQSLRISTPKSIRRIADDVCQERVSHVIRRCFLSHGKGFVLSLF